MAASDFWDYAQNFAQMNGRCNRCDAGTHTEDPPAGAPPQISELTVCDNCDRVVDAA